MRLDAKVLKKLSVLSYEVATLAANASPFNLSLKQSDALNSVLRTLDFRNDYEEGDRLRVAFGIELDAVKYHRQDRALARRVEARRKR